MKISAAASGAAGAAAVPDEAEQQLQQRTAPGAPGAGSKSASVNRGSPTSWPRAAAPPPPTSFFRQLFAEDDADDAGTVAVSRDEVTGAADVSSYVDDLLLPPAAGAFEEPGGDNVFGQLGAFPMNTSFINTAAPPSAGPSSGSDREAPNRPHTLEFVNPPFGIATCSQEPHHRHFNSRVREIDDDDQQTSSSHAAAAAAVKKAKLQPTANHVKPCISESVDASHFQSILNRVNQSQSSRSREKLGERINALQQLVSPFGKTDTASVLSEAIGYIKFLQEQVQVLSSPYMKPCSTRKESGAEGGSDLRSRGLCLVPVSCTMNVANNNNFNIGADYWASTPNLSSTTGSASNATRFSASS